MNTLGLMLMSAVAYGSLRNAGLSHRQQFGIWSASMAAGGLTLLVVVLVLIATVPASATSSTGSTGTIVAVGAVLRWVPVGIAWWVNRVLVRRAVARRLLQATLRSSSSASTSRRNNAAASA